MYGRGARNYLTEIIRRAPFIPALDGRRPQLQFVHVDDVARALAFLATAPHVASAAGAETSAGLVSDGAYNIASADWLALEDVAAIAGKRVVDVPLRLVSPLLERIAHLMPPHLRAPASMLPYLMHPFVVSPRKLALAGCAPLYSSADALREMLARDAR